MGVTGGNVGFDFCALCFWQARYFCIYFSNAVVWVDAEFIKYSGVFFKYVFVIRPRPHAQRGSGRILSSWWL